MRTTLALGCLVASTFAVGCTALVDSTLSGRGTVDGGIDGGPQPDTGPMADTGPESPCAAFPDGTLCTVSGIAARLLCVDSQCVLTQCGDGFPDTPADGGTEDCDDGNDVDGDGCDSDCTFTCADDADCVDDETCNGAETCDTANTHICVAGTMEADNTPCTIPVVGGAAVCHSGACRSGMCPDGVTDPGEQCDDNNAVDADGCDADCTYSCETDSDCQDGDPCNGVETCDAANTHRCMAATQTLDCDDTDPCTNDACVPMMGCTNTSVLVDADGDGHYAIMTCPGGDDCDDTNPNAYPNASEPCGASADLNCDGRVGQTPVWYVDCDADTYSPTTAGAVTSCTRPAPNSGCVSPGWTSRVPTGSAIDCLDSASTGANAHPTETTYYSSSPTGLAPSYDWNCNGTQEHAVTAFGNPFVRTRTFVECGYVGSPLSYCTGTAYYNETSLPHCGATATLSHCVIQLGGCTRVSTETPAACR